MALGQNAQLHTLTPPEAILGFFFLDKLTTASVDRGGERMREGRAGWL